MALSAYSISSGVQDRQSNTRSSFKRRRPYGVYASRWCTNEGKPAILYIEGNEGCYSWHRLCIIIYNNVMTGGMCDGKSIQYNSRL